MVFMTHPAFAIISAYTLALSVGALRLEAQNMLVSAPYQCASAAEMHVYSNVSINKETGDLLGYELAVKRRGDLGIEALLYVYEGGEAGDGIPLSGQVKKNRLTLTGTWVERLVEYPSKKKIVEEHSVEILGTMDTANFRGELTISGMEDHQHVRLRHVRSIWPCNNLNANH